MLSVIIPTRDRAELLANALLSLTAQSISRTDFEVLVIDNASTDHTPSVVKNIGQLLGNIRYHYEPTLGLHAGRHRGMSESRGDILVFADDDIEPLPTWLASIQEAFLDPDVAMVGGNNLPKFTAPPPRWLLTLWNRPTYASGRAFGPLSILQLPDGVYNLDPFYVWGCNFSIRKDLLLQAGGFHPDGMPKHLVRFRGDGESFVSRYVAENGLKCIFHSGASVYHVVTADRMTFSYLRQRGFIQGVSDSYTQLRGEALPPLLTTTRQSQLPMAYRLVRWISYQLQALEKQIRSDREVCHALEQLRLGQQEGFAYHQHLYRSDPEVQEWVHRKQYF